MTAEPASAADLEIARVMRDALDMYLANNGAAPKVDPEPILYSPEQAAEWLGLESTNQLYRRTADGTWPYTKVGKRKKFSKANLLKITEIQNRDAVRKSSSRTLRAA